MRRRHVHRWGLMAGLLAVGGACGGCLVSTSPGLEVLAGTWELKTEATSDLSQLLLTFDRRGNLTGVTIKISTVTIEPSTVTGSADVNGDQVNIVTGLGLGSYFVFNGILDASRTSIVGTVTLNITLPFISIKIDGGAATLVKQ